MDQKEQEKRIDYIEFPTTDMEGVKKFYTTVFGWKFTDWGPDYASFFDGRLNGGFRLAEKASEGDLLVIIYTTDLAGIENSVKAEGGVIVKETFSFPGGRRFHFSDPVGNVLAVWTDSE